MVSHLASYIDKYLDQMVLIHHLIEPSIKAQDVEMFPIRSAPNWRGTIRSFLMNGTLPTNKKKGKEIEN